MQRTSTYSSSGPARQAATRPPPPHTFLGTLNRVEWLCYRNPSDTDAEYARRVAEMREAFEAASRRAGL